jgi:polyhydroxyalkanoate synthesis regulator protein
MSEEAAPPNPVIIKKYANRRLFNTASSRYMSKADVATMIRQQQPFAAVEMRCGSDITGAVMAWVQGVPGQ